VLYAREGAAAGSLISQEGDRHSRVGRDTATVEPPWKGIRYDGMTSSLPAIRGQCKKGRESLPRKKQLTASMSQITHDAVWPHVLPCLFDLVRLEHGICFLFNFVRFVNRSNRRAPTHFS
jgi:hypothetical protein